MNKFLTMMTATGFTATASTGQESRIVPLSGNESIVETQSSGVMSRSYRPTVDGVFSFNIDGNTLKESGDGSLILGIVTYALKCLQKLP